MLAKSDRLWAFAGLLFSSIFFSAHLAVAEGPKEIVAHVGRYSILDADKGVEAGWEARFRSRRLSFQPRWVPDLEPMAGAMATARGTLYGYAGFGLDLPLGAHWVLRPSWAAGLFYQHREKDLGGPLEFRSALELTRRINQKVRLGLSFYHLSNAGFFALNPGSESLVLSLVARP